LTALPVRLIKLSGLLLPERFSFNECLHGRSAAAHLSLMGSFCVVVGYPVIQVCLQLFQRLIQLAPKRNPVKLVQNCFMEPFADAVCLRMSGLGFGVFNVINAKV